MATGHEDLRVWQDAIHLVEASYRIASRLPPIERYGLASQIRRASVSIPANIAEGRGRLHGGDYVRHLSIARGSLRELETLLEIAQRLRYATADDLNPLLEQSDHLGRMLTCLVTAVRRRDRQGYGKE
jgi:four helix bundle protein